jgi:hypothetical protein
LSKNGLPGNKQQNAQAKVQPGMHTEFCNCSHGAECITPGDY